MWRRTLQDVDVLTVRDFWIPCSHSEIPGFCPRFLLTKHEGHGRKLGRPEEPWCHISDVTEICIRLKISPIILAFFILRISPVKKHIQWTQIIQNLFQNWLIFLKIVFRLHVMAPSTCNGKRSIYTQLTKI